MAGPLLLLSAACGAQTSPPAFEVAEPPADVVPAEPAQVAPGDSVTAQQQESQPAANPARADTPQTRERAAVVASAWLDVPAIGVTSPLASLGLNADRSMEVPRDFHVAGWYRYSPAPGEVGPSVIVGHVSTRRRPAVFYRLVDLQPGDEVIVRYRDGPTARFAVDRVEQHPKDAFPTQAVYGNTDSAELRLITCGGDWDGSVGSHRDNIIVYAHLVSFT